MSYFFYRSIFAMFFMVPVGIFFFSRLKERKIKKNKNKLEREFKECILAVGTSMRAGYAVENAFRDSVSDMGRMFGDDSFIVQELTIIRRGLVMNITLEELLADLAVRSGSAHIEQFAQVFEIAKKSGGNMADVIKRSAYLIGRDIDAVSEMETVLSGRKMEQNIMKIVPFLIVIYIDISNKGYFDGLYGNIKGILIMTGCLAAYIAAYILGERILASIEREM